MGEPPWASELTLNAKPRDRSENQETSARADLCLFISGTTILDWSANGRIWSRTGNRSPLKPAAPHGAYPCAGVDQWIAIACFADAEWRALTEVGRYGPLARREDVIAVPPGGDVAPLLEPEAEVYAALELGTRDYVRKNGFEHVVIGLSGGIDSTLTLLIAAGLV